MNMKVQPLEMEQGTTQPFALDLTDANGEPYTLEIGQVLVFAVKTERNDEARVLITTITHTVEGAYYLELAVEDTADLEPGRYYYDVKMQHGARLYPVVPLSPFTIHPTAARLGDGA